MPMFLLFFLDVQNLGIECLDIGILPISPLFGRRKILWWSSNIARYLVGFLFSIYITIKTIEDTFKGEAFDKYIQSIHNIHRAVAICCSFWLYALFSSTGNACKPKVGIQNINSNLSTYVLLKLLLYVPEFWQYIACTTELT